MRKLGGSSVGRDIRAIRTALSSIARAVQRLALLQAAAAGRLREALASRTQVEALY